MKKTAKVFIWIGMIFQFYFIFPIVFGIIALKKLDTAVKRDELVGTGILTLLFCNLIAGILILVMQDSDLEMNHQKIETVNNNL